MKKWLANILLTSISVIFFFVIAEFAVRMLHLNPPVANTASKHELQSVIDFDPILESRYKPNSHTVIQSPYKEFSIQYQFNNQGLRDVDIDNNSNQYKILVLGNSFVEGWGVNRDKTFLQIAETTLNQRTHQGNNIHLINGGVSGYGAVQSYLLAKQLLPKIKPNALVFCYLSTMVNADSKFLEKAELDNVGIATGVNQDTILNGGANSLTQKSSGLARMINHMSEYSALINVIKTRLDNYAAQKQITIGDPKTDLLAGIRAPEQQLLSIQLPTLKHIVALSRQAKALDIPFLVIILPMPHQLSSIEWQEGRKAYNLKPLIYSKNDEIIAENFLRLKQIPVISAYDFLKAHTAQASQPSKKIYYTYDFHLNEKGQNYLGLWMADVLTKEKLLNRG